MTKKTILLDSVLSIIAFAIPVCAQQLFVMPVLANRFPDYIYGNLVTQIAIINYFPASFGYDLGRVRLLTQNNYCQHEHHYDFRVLFILGCLLNSLCVTVASFGFGIISGAQETFVIVLLNILYLTQAYLITEYRIFLDYKNLIVNNLFFVLGYGVGALVTLKTNSWPWMFIFGTSFSILCSLHYVRYAPLKYKAKKLHLGEASKMLLALVVASLLGAFGYMDKLIIHPILGATAVAVYYAASVIGKITSMLTNPLSNLMISYFSKETNASIKLFWKFFGAGTIIAILGYGMSMLISKPVLNLLYAPLAKQAIEILPYVLLPIAINVLATSISSFVLCFRKKHLQVIINGITLALYIFLGAVFAKELGVIGLCIGMSISFSARVLLYVVFFVFTKPEVRLNKM